MQNKDYSLKKEFGGNSTNLRRIKSKKVSRFVIYMKTMNKTFSPGLKISPDLKYKI